MPRMYRLLPVCLLWAASLSAQDAPPSLAAGGIVDGAGYGRAIAPGTVVSVFGTGLARNTVLADAVPLPTVLDGVSLELDDGAAVRNAPLFLVSPTQINAQVPYLAGGTSLAVRVRNANGVSGPGNIALVDAAPALFTGAAGEPLVFHSDFTPVTSAAPAAAGETLVAYLTGLGMVDPPVEAGAPAGDGAANGPLSRTRASVEVIVGGQPGVVQFAGLAPGYIGVYQVNFAVPQALSTGRHVVAVSASAQRSQPNLSVAVVNASGPREYWAAPNGSPAGDGSRANPWDLKTALAGPPAVRPGDIVWLAGGAYGNGASIFESRLAGTAQKPVIVRQAPGARATINGGLAVYGPYTWFWGFEVTNTSTDRGAGRSVPECVDTYDGSSGVKLINLVLHDCNQGVGFWIGADNGELYGSIIYHNGTQGAARGQGHGIYTQNQNGTKSITDNIVFNQFGLGIQAYGSSKAFVQGYDVQGNIIFNNGIISAGQTNVDNILFGIGVPMERIRLESNYTYHKPDANKGYSRVGWELSSAENKDVVVRNNYFIGGQSAVEMWNWSQATFTGNVTYSQSALNVILALAPDQAAQTYSWDKNTYYGSGKLRFGGQNQGWDNWRALTSLDGSSRFTPGRPTGLWTMVRPNKYEPGRAHIAVYNWDLKEKVPVDLSGVLKPGAQYEIRDAENFFGPPVASGSWDGAPVSIPMTGLTVAPTVGDVPSPPSHTAPEFGAFVVLPK